MTAIAPLYVYAYTASAHLFIHDEEADFKVSFRMIYAPMEAGSCTYGLWLNAKGRVLGDSWLLCEGDNQYRFAFLFDAPKGDSVDALEQHIVADDVEIDAQPSASMLCVSGKEADACLQFILGQPMPKTDRECVQLGATIFQARRSYLGAYEVLCRTPADADKLVQQLQQASAQV